MQIKLRSRLMLLFMSLAMVIAIPAMAIADTLTISNTLVTNTDTSKAPGGTGTANVWLEVTNNDPTDAKGCNVTSSDPGTVTLKSNNPDVTFPNGNTAQLTDCYKDANNTNAKGIAYKVADNAQAGQAILSATVTGGKSGQTNRYNTNDALTVTITAPAKQNTSTSNVSGDGTYGGNATLTATLKTASGAALSGKSVDFKLDGNSVGSATTGTNGVATKSVSLSGINAGSYTNYVSANFAGDSSNNGSTGSGNLSVSKAAGSVSVNNLPSNAVFGGDFTPTYAKAGDGASSTISNTPGVCSVNAGVVSFDAAGTCKLQASVAEGTNHLQANGAEQSFPIDRANATINVNGFTGTYDGIAKGASGTATGVGSADVSSLLNLGDKFTNVPGGTANWSFAGNDNYKPASGSVAIKIDKASSDTKVTCPASVTYTGQPRTPCTVSVTGAGGLNLSPNADYSDNVNAGTATASASYAGSANHLGSSDSKTFAIDKAEATIKVNGFDGIYDGTAKGASGTATGVDGSNLNSLLNLGNEFTDFPGGTANWSFVGNANHKAANGSVAIKIAKTLTTTTVSCEAGPLTYNGSAQKPCSASVSGAGGLDQSLPVIYQNNVNAGTATANASYDASANHLGSSDSKTFKIAQATAQVSLSNLNHIFDGTAKAATVSTDPADLNVSVTYNGSATAPTTVGSYNVVATVNDANYEGSANGTLVIKPWTLKGFYAPVDMNNVLNTVKGGSTVPLKFQLFKGTAELTDTAQVKALQASKVSCTSGTGEDLVETTTTGATSLRYDTTGGQFIYNWKTPTGAGTCYKVTISANDGSSQTALFKIK